MKTLLCTMILFLCSINFSFACDRSDLDCTMQKWTADRDAWLAQKDSKEEQIVRQAIEQIANMTPCISGFPGCTKELIETETAGNQAARGLLDAWEKGGREQATQLWRRLQQTQTQQKEASRREQEFQLHFQHQEEALKRQQTEQSYYTEEQARNGRIAEALKRAFEGIGRTAQERNQRIQAIQPIQPVQNNNIHCTQRPDGFGGSRTDCY